MIAKHVGVRWAWMSR